MSARPPAIANRRDIVDRRALAETLAGADRQEAAVILKQALGEGRAEIARRLEEKPYAGAETAAAYAFLTNQLLRLAFDFVTQRLHPIANPTTSGKSKASR